MKNLLLLLALAITLPLPCVQGAKKASKKATKVQPAATAEQAVEQDINQITPRDLLKQKNGWECGYYSAFHYLTTKRELGLKRKQKPTEKQYEAFIKKLQPLHPNIQRAREGRLCIGGEHVEFIIRNMDGGDLNEVLVIDGQQISGCIPTESATIGKIHALRNRHTPFWALVCINFHWICLMFPADGGCIGIDSASNATLLNPKVKVIKDLCLGIVPLPSTDQFLDAYRNYQGIMAIPNTAPELLEDAINVFYNDALLNGFTAETLRALIDHLEWRHKMDHRPQPKPKPAKK